MNPNSTQGPILTPSPVPARDGRHIASVIILILLILASFVFVGWKWFANQEEMRILEAQNAAMRADFANSTQDQAVVEPAASISDGNGSDQASVSRSVKNNDALESDMSLILNSSSEDDLRSIDQEF